MNPTYRGLTLVAPGELRLEHHEVPEPGPGELLVRVRAATTCGTDLKAWRRGHPMIPMPGPFGHEYAGVVESAGAGARFEPGQAVMGVHSAPCQACDWCRRGQENLCQEIMATKVLGAYAELLLIPARIAQLNVYEKSDPLPFETASLLEPLACVAQAVAEAAPRAGESALVIGPGAIGLMFAASLRLCGAARVTVAGRNPTRLALAEPMGASPAQVPLGLEHEESYDLVVECTGQVDVWNDAIRFVRRGGTLMLYGGPPAGTRVTFDTHRLHYDQIRVLSPFHFGTAAVRQAREWLIQSPETFDRLITARLTLDRAAEAFPRLEAGQDVKIAILP